MQKEYFYCIGLMSGTSLDGIDLVYVKINAQLYSDFEILKTSTVSYSKEWKTKLQEAITYTAPNLKALDKAYGMLLGGELNKFIKANNIIKLDFIASHGHTILHQPKKGVTLQIGNGQVIAEVTKQKVICDFRTQDVALGGEGAPLVPIGDKLLFANYEYCLNLGGFANVSYEQAQKRIAFDVCPVNIVLNHYTRKIALEYDDEGKIASKGEINTVLLEKLNSLAFYKKNPPKSLGLEWVQKNVFPLIDNYESNIPTILRTFIEHIAFQIERVITKKKTVLITGGGAFNTFLMQRIETRIKTTIPLVSKELINYKEALIFALLGVLRMQDKVNCLQSVTGARKDHSSGKIFYAKK